MKPRNELALRCAIYTRKSSEEGLEQEFNSLHAQRGQSGNRPGAHVGARRVVEWLRDCGQSGNPRKSRLCKVCVNQARRRTIVNRGQSEIYSIIRRRTSGSTSLDDGLKRPDLHL
jgi:hypothetical protein